MIDKGSDFVLDVVLRGPNQHGPNRLYFCQWKGKPMEEN